MSRISSLTETTGVRSPHSLSTGGEAGAGFGDEHEAAITPTHNTV
jgi:hypothetical protein